MTGGRLITAALLLFAGAAAAQAPESPAVPAYESLVPAMPSGQPRSTGPLPTRDLTEEAARNPEALACVAGDCKELDAAPFGTGTHSALVRGAKACSDPLISAVYWQDYFHQFESRAHFDNCAFDDTLAYVEELQRAVDDHIQTSRPIDVRKVMFTLGQALHAIQDFYAHSDYVERMQSNARFGDVPILPVWTAEGRARVQELARSGMVSGVVWWGAPKYCKAGTATHGEMSKDHRDSGRGAQPTRWQHWSHFDAAHRLAQEASEAFLRYAFARWPEVGRACGNAMVYVVTPDARREPPSR